ncbi:MAG: hypothetical protein IJJ60_11045, partial [Clostridia bacterium]|nr:hypothetical protein [Clostridia bacterium]
GGGYYDIVATPTYPADLQSSFSIVFAGTVFAGGPLELKITTPTASKPYDGTPLTSTDVTVEGLDESDAIVVTVTGSQTDAGSSANTYTIDWGDTNKDDYTIVEELGTLTVEPKTVTVSTGSAEKPYDGSALTCVNPAPAIDGLIDGDGATVTATGTITAVGTADNTYSIEWDEGTLAGNYAIVDDLGTLTVTPAQISITTKSASKQFDGQPLTCWELESNYTAVGDGDTFTITLENNEKMTVTFQGSQTGVGTGSNTCQIAWDGEVAGNYEISPTLGTLTVTKNTAEVLLTAASATKEYDGTPLTAAEAAGLAEWFSVVPTMTEASTLTDVGFCDNVIKSHKIYLDDEDVTANFTNVKYAKGTLTVTSPEIVTILASAEKTYDGAPLTPTAANTTVTMDPALEGYTAEVTMTGNLTNAGSTDAEVTSFTIRKGGEDVTALFPNATAAGMLTVNKFPVQIVTGSASKVYNGSAAHSDVLTVNGSAPKRTDEVYCEYQLVGSDKLTQMRTAGLADVGKIDNECSYSLAAVANPDNYEITETWGELEVTAQTVTVQLVNSVTTFQGPVTPDAMTAVYGDNSAVTRFQMNTESGKL